MDNYAHTNLLGF